MNQSNRYNLSALLLLAALGLLILGLGAILYFDDNAEEATGRTPRLAEQDSTTPEIAQQSRIVREPPAPLLLAPDASLYAPQDYELDMIEQNDFPETSQTGSEDLDDIVEYESRSAMSQRSITAENVTGEPDRRFDAERRQDAMAERRSQRSPRSAPARRVPEYGSSQGNGSGMDWRAQETRPSVRPQRGIQPSYGASQAYPHYQTPAPAQGYSQPYTQPYYSAPQVPRRDMGASTAYPAPDSRWLPSEQTPYANPPYPEPRGYTDRYWDDR